MATLSAPSTPSSTANFVDPTKQAEYPIILGDQLARKGSRIDGRLIGITYNHKTKKTTPSQRTTIYPSKGAHDGYRLTIQDKTPEQGNLTYSYDGSVDPSSLVSGPESSHLVLVFDPKRKAFILEPVSTQLNFNLRSAPGKTDKQVREQYPRLGVLPDDEHDGRLSASEDEDSGAPDESNPFDYRHFLPKPGAENESKGGGLSSNTTPDPHTAASKPGTPLYGAPSADQLKPKPGPARPRQQTNPLRQQKRAPKAAGGAGAGAAKPKPKSAPRIPPEDLVDESSASEAGGSIRKEKEQHKQTRAPSPSTNIIVDGDLIIDMGSPPSRPKFMVDPRHFSSNNTSANEADDSDDDEGEEIEDLQLPPPAGGPQIVTSAVENQDDDDDDGLAAEMEAAFEESAREEEARNQQLQMQQQAFSEEESEVSEEE